ncbi:MAG: ABC transporter substrate-binding protein [Candidatus Zixiibacteriota bacterium]
MHKAKILIINIIIVFLIFGSSTYATTVKLAITYSDSLKSTLRTMRGIKSQIEQNYTDVIFKEFLLVNDPAGNSSIISEIKNFDPKLILTVGSFATEVISAKLTDKPIVFAAVLNPETSGFVKTMQNPGGNITGSSLDIPPDIQFKYFKRVIQNLKKVGVLYSDETANLIPPAMALAKQAGLELHTVKIQSEKEIPKAFDSLSLIVDAFWSVADFQIYSPHSTRYILLNTLRNGKPFMAFSKNLVESGALFALDYDYKDIGRQAGQIASEVISGRSPGSIEVAVPGIIWFHYNEKTAKHINVVIPEDLAAVAKEVFK